MTIDYDDKGKFYTSIISKDTVKTRIQTTAQIIEGDVHVRRQCRLKDELVNGEPFLAVTDAYVFDNSGEALFHTGFICRQTRSNHLGHHA
jgi:uncharacterized protein YcfJ